MAYVWKHPNSKFWTAVYRDERNVWVKKTTKKTAKTTALALALEWERAASLGRDRVLTESLSREVIGGILERTTGEKLRQSTLREFCKEWLANKTRSRQDGTTTRYTATIDRFLEFTGNKAELPIAAVTPHDAQKFYDHLAAKNLAPASLVVEMKTVSGVFNHARRLGLIATNPLTAIELPERIKQVKGKLSRRHKSNCSSMQRIACRMMTPPESFRNGPGPNGRPQFCLAISRACDLATR